MSDEEEDGKVVSLDAHREEVAERNGEAAHERGDAFKFEMIDDPVDHLGTTPGAVVFMPDPESLSGFAFASDAARKLAIALIELAAQADAEYSELTRCDEADPEDEA